MTDSGTAGDCAMTASAASVVSTEIENNLCMFEGDALATGLGVFTSAYADAYMISVTHIGGCR